MDFDKFAKMRLDVQEKSALSFFITNLIRTQPDSRYVVKEICDKLSELWDEKINEIFESNESSQNLKSKKKTSMFRRIE